MTAALRLRAGWPRLLLLSVGLALLFAAVTVQPAAAAPPVVGQAPPEYSWIKIDDSHGVSVWNYELALDRGGITDPGKFVWSMIVDQTWGIYWTTVSMAIWFLDWVLGFDWVTLIATPLLSIGDALHATMSDLGLVPTFLAAAALLAVLWMTRGKWATGVWELAVTLVVAALATGALASPVHLVADPGSGYLYKARDAGFEIAAALATGHADSGQATPAAMRQSLTGQLATTFLRQPAQIINFGRVLDGGKCESAYTDATKSGPHGFESDIRDKVASCDSALGDYSDNPSASMATGALVFVPAAWVILLLGIVVAGSVLLAGVNVLWQSLKLIVNLVAGLLPGGTRGSLLLTLSEAVMSLLLLAFTTVFLAVFMELVQVLFREAKGDQIPKAFLTTDIVLILGVLTYLKARRRINEAAHRLAQFLSQRPGTGAKPTRIPEPISSGIGRTAGRVAAAGATLAYLKRGRSGSSPPPPSAAQGPAATSRTAFSGAGQPPGAGADGNPGSAPSGGGSPAPAPVGTGGGGLARVTARGLVTAGLRVGARGALSYATGGTSTLASAALTGGRARRAAQLLGSPRRQALTGRLALPPARPTPAGRRLVHPELGPSTPSPGRPSSALLPPAPRRPALPAGPTASRGVVERRPAAGRSYDRVVRDGQVVIVPRTPPRTPPGARLGLTPTASRPIAAQLPTPPAASTTPAPRPDPSGTAAQPPTPPTPQPPPSTSPQPTSRPSRPPRRPDRRRPRR